MRVCSICATECEDKECCATCVAQFPHRRDADEMTGEERVAELQKWYGPLEIPFSLLHQRIEELVGRPVWTHELALCRDRLFEEARTRGTEKRPAPSLEELLGPLEKMGKKVVLVPLVKSPSDNAGE